MICPFVVSKPNLATSVPSRLYQEIVSPSGSVAATAAPMFDAITTAVSPGVSLKVRDGLLPSLNVGGSFTWSFVGLVRMYSVSDHALSISSVLASIRISYFVFGNRFVMPNAVG